MPDTATTTESGLPLVVPVPEAQRLLGGLSRATIDRYLRAGRLKRAPVGGRRVLVTRASIESLLDHDGAPR